MATIERESLGFGELHLARGGHVAHFFETDQEGLDLLVCYIKTGLEAGQRCIHFVGTERERDPRSGYTSDRKRKLDTES